MDIAEATAIENLAITGLQVGVKLYNELRSKNPSLPPLADILADADTRADAVIKTADEQITEAQALQNLPT